MKIGKKLLLGFSIIVAFLIISAIVTTVYTLRINSKLHKITEEVNPSETDVQDMISILWRSNYIVQKYSTEEDSETLEDLEFEFEHINELFARKSDRVYNLGSKELQGKVSQATNKHSTFYQLSKRLMDKRAEDVANKIVYKESSILVQYSIAKQLERDVVDAVESLQEALEELSVIKQLAKEESNAAVKVAISMILLIALIGIITTFTVWSSLTTTIIKRINLLSEASHKLSKGNFDIEIESDDGDDEISELSSTFNQMVLSLRKILQESPRLKKFITLQGKKEKLMQKYIIESGTSYLIKEPTSEEAYEILMGKIEIYSPLLITRDNLSLIEQKYGIPKKNMIWLSDEKEKGIVSTSNLNQLQKTIVEFLSKNEKSILLLDRSDYIMNKYGFENFLKFITNINDKIMGKNAILLLPVDPQIFNNKQLSRLEKEIHSPPQQTVTETISDELKSILKFISDSNSINKPATYKDIGAKFTITAPTTKKKLEELHSLGLIRVTKVGRNKVLKTTRDGNRILASSTF